MATLKVDENPFPKLLLQLDGDDGTPDADQVALYAAADGTLHTVQDDGTDVEVGAGGGPTEILDIPTAETDDTLVLAPDGAGGVEWRAEAGGGGGGGVTHAYLGYNTAGGSLEAMVQYRMYCKKVTLSADGLLASIGAYVEDDGATHVASLAVALFDDNSNAPGKVIGYAGISADVTFIPLTTYGQRWVDMPMGKWLTAGDYWVGVFGVSNSTALRLAYDGSGSDQYFTAGGAWVADATFHTITTGSRKYSIRASVIN